MHAVNAILAVALSGTVVLGTLELIRAVVPKRFRGLAEFVLLGPVLWLGVETIRGLRDVWAVLRGDV